MKLGLAALAASALVAIGSANAATFTIDFEGLSNPGTTSTAVNGFYNGGTDSGGATGVNYGISFTNANVDSYSSANGLYGITSAIAYMPTSPLGFSSALGFKSFSFDQFFWFGGNVLTVYSGVDGTGTVLATYTFGANCPTCTTVRQDVTFSGIAHSATLTPNANGSGIDNLTITAVPEPAAWGMMIAGFGMIGAAMRRRRAAIRFA